eukprot:CAMPEP_0179326036 /NCGR_PEP_ID=MMETSP0797-20121207/61214_1 /TAXON_ID=47934 /ORGANISM="Dinophysis acuminata, Strain DAEP01" /LENGTH=151 /DNA_ID=CAMNT_0021038267 /DNA_START=81 /DNA_END=533 /DNA_ORIENTATION=-
MRLAVCRMNESCSLFDGDGALFWLSVSCVSSGRNTSKSNSTTHATQARVPAVQEFVCLVRRQSVTASEARPAARGTCRARRRLFIAGTSPGVPAYQPESLELTSLHRAGRSGWTFRRAAVQQLRTKANFVQRPTSGEPASLHCAGHGTLRR